MSTIIEILKATEEIRPISSEASEEALRRALRASLRQEQERLARAGRPDPRPVVEHPEQRD
jgi:hypothetical protein